MLEEIFEKSLNDLQKGSSPEEAVAFCSDEEKKEILPLLEIASSFSRLPKNPVPQPVMQRKYALAPVKVLWFKSLHFIRLATVTMSLLLLVTAVAGTGYAALNSLPGQTLFAIKKSTEQIQLKFARSPQDKVNLQLEIGKKRLSEAEMVLKDPSMQPNSATAAINELVSQTKTTADAVQKIAKADPDPKRTQPMVNSLENLAEQQQQLIKGINPAAEKVAVSDAEKTSKETSNQIEEIKKFIQIASSEQTLIDLKDKKNQETLGQVESASSSASSTKAENSEINESNSSSSSTRQSANDQTLKDPNTVIGSFIIEDPAPQFNP